MNGRYQCADFQWLVLSGGVGLLWSVGCGEQRSSVTDPAVMARSAGSPSSSAGGAAATTRTGEGGASVATSAVSVDAGRAGASALGAIVADVGGRGGMLGAPTGSADAGPSAAIAPCLEFGEPQEVGSIASLGLPGPSGIAASRTQPGVLYLHEDAGGDAMFFAMDRFGADRGQYALDGATATDWEDIAVGPGPGGSFVFLGDFGDNAARMGGTTRTEIQIYRVLEPDVSQAEPGVTEPIADWEVLRFTYPDAPHDAETLMVDPVTLDLLILTKADDGDSLLFRAGVDTPVDTPTQLERIGGYQFDGAGRSLQASAGDISPSGNRIAVRTYDAIHLWPRAVGDSIGPSFNVPSVIVPSPVEPQGEGLTFSADGRAWFAAGEQVKALYRGEALCAEP